MIYRGDIVTVIAPGDFGKPRPAVVIQANVLTEARVKTLLVCLVTSEIVDVSKFRLMVAPNQQNGLRQKSQIMVEKIISIPRRRVGEVIGRLDDETMLTLNRSLAFVLGLGH